jgi:hypothetical protein
MTVEDLVREIDLRLSDLNLNVNNLTLREKVLRLVDLNYDVKCLGVRAVCDEGLSRKSAVERIRVYLLKHVGTIIDGAEIAVVSGISDYPRRIRELRVEEGYRIASGASPDEFTGLSLLPDQYVLTSPDIDEGLARRWHIANRIRRSKDGSKKKLIEFLRANVGKVVTTEELSYVSNDKKEFGRRTRELRTEEGFAIATRFSGRPDLRMGEYVLLSAERIAEPHDRRIPDEVQKRVYARDENRCRNPACGYSWTSDDPRILELHHIVEHVKRGPNTEDNLVVLCNLCHDDVHAGRLNLDFFIPE